ncbi:DNA-binding protein [Streptococcus pacificus]|uniref:DNA-binding protein n=1 Tax=Streptococcus pacificus TaxID=2740577 RepID=A0ABS0ZKF5_9STRE|nr:DNA-binding protein [Streptococcus pacificus]MBJ8326490.1 DNA-binding protein [Streptococcus pacificus]
MDELMDQLFDMFEEGLKAKALKVMTIVNDEKHRYPLELTKAQCSEMLLGTKDTKTFEYRFLTLDDFPVIKNKGGYDKFPRDAVIEWYNKNWMRTGRKYRID